MVKALAAKNIKYVNSLSLPKVSKYSKKNVEETIRNRVICERRGNKGY